MKVYNTIDMNQNHVVNCPDIAPHYQLTQAEYDALKLAGEIDESSLYLITDDRDCLVVDISDSDISITKTWSSYKINELIQSLEARIAALEGGGN